MYAGNKPEREREARKRRTATRVSFVLTISTALTLSKQPKQSQRDKRTGEERKEEHIAVSAVRMRSRRWRHKEGKRETKASEAKLGGVPVRLAPSQAQPTRSSSARRTP